MNQGPRVKNLVSGSLQVILRNRARNKKFIYKQSNKYRSFMKNKKIHIYFQGLSIPIMIKFEILGPQNNIKDFQKIFVTFVGNGRTTIH